MTRRNGPRPRESRIDAREARRRRNELRREFTIVRLAHRDPRRTQRLDAILDAFNQLPKDEQ